MTRRKYTTPTLKAKKLQLNYFYQSRGRSLDSMNNFLSVDILATSHGCGGCGSKSIENPV